MSASVGSQLGIALASGNYEDVGQAQEGAVVASFLSVGFQNLSEELGPIIRSFFGFGGASSHEGTGTVEGPQGQERAILVRTGQEIRNRRDTASVDGGLTISVPIYATGDVTRATQDALLQSGRQVTDIVRSGLIEQGVLE